MERSGIFTISLDFELHWGTDSVMEESLLGARRAIPRMLDLFQLYEIHATWATVGFLFFGSREELLSSLPEKRPRYAEAKNSGYHRLGSVGTDEVEDPFHFAKSLVEKVGAVRGQEIATHTLSHYCCLEPGHDAESFSQDIATAVTVSRRCGFDISSIVFPRNQVNAEYLDICLKYGITSYRGLESGWMYRVTSEEEDTLLKRRLRLLDSYFNVTGHHTYSLDQVRDGAMYNIRGTRILRPYKKQLALLEPMRLRRITRGMSHAARRQHVYHLWWHPQNFGLNMEENLDFLGKVLKHFAGLRQSTGMRSLSMCEISCIA